MADDEEGQSLWHQLGHGTQRVTSEDRIIWTIFSIFFAANAILLRVVFTSGQEHARLRNLVVPLFGIVMSMVWFFVQRRALAHMEAWEKIIQRLEKKLKIETDLTFSSYINPCYLRDLPCPRARPIMRWSPLVLAAFWLAILFLLFCH